MAKRPADDDDDDDKPVRKRRYRPPKKADDEDDAPMRRRGRQDEEDDDDENQWGVSTGNVYFDITLDFRDDCIEWAQEHLLYAILISSVTFLIVATLTYLFIHSWVRYLNRPSLKTVTQVYDLGYFPETKLLADYALQYISPRKPQSRTPFLFLQGAALCAIAERVVPADKRDYYLTAANYLKEAAMYNFLPERAPEGWFLLGKSLFHCGELDQCRDPLRIALEDGYPHTKSVYWYLSNAYFFGSPPDLQRARQYLQLYQEEPTALEEEIAESRLLEAMIDLHIDGIEAGEKRLAQVPRFEQFALMRHFVEGQIELFKARRIRAQAIDLETDPNPSLLRYAPVAPAPVKPEPLTESPIEPIVPPDDVPAVPAPVIPFDDAALRELMPPRAPPEPVLGMFDGASEVQQRIAELRLQYAQNVTDGEVILLPREETKPEPVQDSPPETVFDPYNDDPVMKRAREYRNVAADHYQRAINHFAEVIRMADAHVPWGRTARLLTGICYLEMEKGKAKEAETSFRSLIEAFPDSAEAAGANFLLAEHDRTMGNTEASFRSFAQAFRNLRRNPQYASLWLTKAAMMEQCKAMVRSDIEKRRYEETLKLLDLLNGVMPQDERVRLIGESYESWAALLQSQAETTFGEKGNQIAKDAESKWRQAGAAFAALAQLLSDTREFTDLLWRSAENYRLGKDYRNGIVEYRKFSQANMVDHRPELNLRLGEMYLHLDFLGEAEYVLEEALHDFPAHPLVPQIRLVLSHVYSERKDWDKAKALLQLNLVGEAAPSSGPYRDSMYELGKISFAQGDFDSAIPYLEDAVKVHPDAIQAADANYMLAHAYLKRADDALRELDNNPPEAVRRSVESVVQTNRYRALSYLDKTESILADRQRAMGLTEAEKLMLRNVYFLSCSLLLKMEQYEQVIPRLNTVATIYLDKEEALDALLKMAYAMRMVGRDVESQTTLRRAEVLLNQMEKLGIISDGTSWRRTIQRQIKQ